MSLANIAEKGDACRMKTYPGGKGLSFRNIINLIPPHEVYIETHLGGGAVMRHKKPAKKNIAIDLDGEVIAYWQNHTDKLPADTRLICASAHDFLTTYPFCGNELVYCDPPYIRSTRRSGRLYRHEYTDEDHRRLLELITSLPCKVLLSGYANPLYAQYLQQWNVVSFNAKTHGGTATETLWFNFEKPTVLHDDRYLGANFREREKIRRRTENLKKKISGLDAREQQMISQWLNHKIGMNAQRNAPAEHKPEGRVR